MARNSSSCAPNTLLRWNSLAALQLGLFALMALVVAGCGGASGAGETSASEAQGDARPAAATSPQDDVVNYDGAHFKRVNLVVSDLERALTIYRDILGFVPGNIGTSSADSYSYPVFKIDPAAKLRFVTLSAPPEQIRTLALTEVTGIELPRRSLPHLTASVIRVNDIEATFEKILALDLEVTETKYAGGTEFKFWERAFVDYDGHLIVLYQIDESTIVGG